MKTIEEMKELKNKVLNMDCLEYMKQVPDNYFDLVLTDPPYEISKSEAGKSSIMSLDKFTSKGKLADISDGIDIDKVLNELLRVCKKCNMFIFCSNKQLSRMMRWGEDKGFYVTCLVWHKYNSAPFANGVWRQDIEFCVHIREKGAYFDGGADLKQKVTRLPLNPSEFGHPTEKPIKLIEKYIQIGSDKGHKIFDAFMGSGTTAVASKTLEREFYGTELDKDYCKIIEKRLSQVQGSLF